MPPSNDERNPRTQRLYELPLDEFRAERDELARALRADGQPEEAAAVKRLRKPSVAAWALNQMRRKERKRVDALIEAGRRLGEAQERLLSGGDRKALDRAVADERELVAQLARRAEKELAAAGRPPSASLQEKVRATLHAAATDPEARELLAAGRLAHDYTAAGLGPLFPGADERSRRAPAGDQLSSPAVEDRAAARRARELAQKLERARDKQEQAEGALAEAKRRAEETRKAAERAAAALRRAEAAERRAREKARQAAARTTELERSPQRR